ncbi:MAG: MBL fold metallo-hydrolase [Muribaculaceae bacterium]|nr:MBL fold metallo-hydrolase [Muribaculaceae bacterium]
MFDAEITMLGTGSAFPVRSYNTCFLLRTTDLLLLVDAGGGNGIIERIHAAGTNPADIPDMFITHAHTDHILGAVWIIRSWINAEIAGNGARRTIYGNRDVIEAITEICRLTLLKSHFDIFRKTVTLHTVAHDYRISFGQTDIRFIDCRCTNVNQTGLDITLPSGTRLVCLGDEALSEANSHEAEQAQWLMCGAFCRHADADIYHPYEKHHRTVLDVARQAEKAGIANLVLYHSEDRTPCRQDAYRAEAAQAFSGNIIVPDDGDTITIV